MTAQIDEISYFKQLPFDLFFIIISIVKIILAGFLLDFYLFCSVCIDKRSDQNIFLVNVYYSSKSLDIRSYLFSFHKMPASFKIYLTFLTFQSIFLKFPF
jgi:hypothetical protein